MVFWMFFCGWFEVVFLNGFWAFCTGLGVVFWMFFFLVGEFGWVCVGFWGAGGLGVVLHFVGVGSGVVLGLDSFWVGLGVLFGWFSGTKSWLYGFCRDFIWFCSD